MEEERLTRKPCSIGLTAIRHRSVWFVSCGHRVCGLCGVEVARRSTGGIRCPLCRADTSLILTRPRHFGHGRHCLCRRLRNPSGKYLTPKSLSCAGHDVAALGERTSSCSRPKFCHSKSWGQKAISVRRCTVRDRHQQNRYDDFAERRRVSSNSGRKAV